MPFDTDAALLGYGPTGAILANFLGARGWRVDAFDRSPGIFQQPRAVHFDDEIMRVFQQLDLADAVAPATTLVRGMDLVNGAGELLFRFDAPPGDGALGWPKGFMFYQPDLERALRAGAARFASVATHLSHEVIAVDADATTGGAIVDVDGPAGRRSIGARFAIGCCGARSITRDAIGASLFDYGVHQPWLVIDIVLERDVGLPAVTVQYCNPARPSTYVPMPGARRRFEFMMMSGDAAEEMLAPGRIAALLAPWLAPSDYRVDRAVIYTFHGLVADRWRRGPLVIAGDAAHQMPPFLGQGLCSGARDAANLAWKLDLILRGVASDTLLDTYQAEREPHVRTLIETDIYLGGIVQTIDPEVARQRDAMARTGGAATALTPSFPPIGGDLCGYDAAARLPFPQPRLADGRRHDVRLGEGFVLVGPVAPSPAASRTLEWVGTTCLHTPDPEIGAWLASQGAVAAVVRPDRNVLALVADAADLDRVLAPLAAHLIPPRGGV